VLELRNKITTWRGVDRQRKVHSPTLQELVVESERAWLSRIDVVAPMLKQLTLSFWAYKEATISVSAPMLHKVSWQCCYGKKAIGFGLWSLDMLRLETAETRGQLPSLQIYASKVRHTSPAQFTRVLFNRTKFCESDIYLSTKFPFQTSYTFSIEEANLTREIEKHAVLEFSDLELHLSTMGHVFGALVLHLLKMKQNRSVLRRLKVVREGSQVIISTLLILYIS
jgi:hypothetical protein